MTAVALLLVGFLLGYVAASGRWQQTCAVLGDETYRGGAGPATAYEPVVLASSHSPPRLDRAA